MEDIVVFLSLKVIYPDNSFKIQLKIRHLWGWVLRGLKNARIAHITFVEIPQLKIKFILNYKHGYLIHT